MVGIETSLKATTLDETAKAVSADGEDGGSAQVRVQGGAEPLRPRPRPGPGPGLRPRPRRSRQGDRRRAGISKTGEGLARSQTMS